MATPKDILERFESSPPVPKGFIEVPYGPNLTLINVDDISHVKIHDGKLYIILNSQRHDGGQESIITTLSYDQVKTLIAVARK